MVIAGWGPSQRKPEEDEEQRRDTGGATTKDWSGGEKREKPEST